MVFREPESSSKLGVNYEGNLHHEMKPNASLICPKEASSGRRSSLATAQCLS